MATNTLNTLFSVQTQISNMEKELEKLRESEKELIGKVLSSGSLENRYYVLKSKVRAGNRVIQIHLLKEKYPEAAKVIIKETASITDAKKVLGDDLITNISIKQADTIRYYVEKKPSEPVMVV